MPKGNKISSNTNNRTEITIPREILLGFTKDTNSTIEIEARPYTGKDGVKRTFSRVTFRANMINGVWPTVGKEINEYLKQKTLKGEPPKIGFPFMITLADRDIFKLDNFGSTPQEKDISITSNINELVKMTEVQANMLRTNAAMYKQEKQAVILGSDESQTEDGPLKQYLISKGLNVSIKEGIALARKEYQGYLQDYTSGNHEAFNNLPFAKKIETMKTLVPYLSGGYYVGLVEYLDALAAIDGQQWEVAAVQTSGDFYEFRVKFI